MIWSLYNLAIKLLLLGLRLHSIFNEKSRKTLKGRKLKYDFEKKSKKRILVHCASLGEFEQARSVIEKLNDYGNEIILSFFSPSGYEVQKDYKIAKSVIYLPFDTKQKSQDFIKKLDPDLVIFVKYEFWWNLLLALQRAKIPIVFISATFRKRQYFFRKIFNPFLETLKCVTHFFLIDENSAYILKKHGISNYTVTGDTRPESIIKRKFQNRKIEIIEKFIAGDKAIIFGSTYPQFNDWLVTSGMHELKGQKILVFPHEIDKKEIDKLISSLGERSIKYSEISEYKEPLANKDILIVDKIGILADAYKYAKIAYIGGGFNNGIHNILEPFAYKIPLIYGPKFQKFYEANYLYSQTFTRTIDHLNEINRAIQELITRETDDKMKACYDHLFNPGVFPSQKIIEYLQLNKLIDGKK